MELLGCLLAFVCSIGGVMLWAWFASKEDRDRINAEIAAKKQAGETQ